GNRAAVFLNAGQGIFGSVQALGPDFDRYPEEVAAGDFDGDGVEELALKFLLGPETRIAVVGVTGTAVSHERRVKANIARMCVADFDGDGADDLALTGGRYTDWFG